MMTPYGMHTVAEVQEMILDNRVLLLAGEEALLAQLPPGRWIGGTSANFMTGEGGKTRRDQVFVTDITSYVEQIDIKTYTVAQLSEIGRGYPHNGFTMLIVPGLSDIHGHYAKNIQTYDGVFNAPLVGWISGVHVSEIGQKAPKVFAGNGSPLGHEAVAMHISIPANKAAHVDIINLFVQGQGEAILFADDGFSSAGDSSIDGQSWNLARYIQEKGIDTKLPLVADYNGAMINVSIQAVDQEKGIVHFYAPVFKGITYRFAEPVTDYTTAFGAALRHNDTEGTVFSCNCILNYLYADLEGKKTGGLTGPITFGEIAYMLLNQTLVYVSLKDV